MRILVATTSQYIAFHGQAIFTINLSECLVRRGHQVMVLSSSEQGRPYHTEINGVRSEALQSRSLGIIHPDSYLPILPGIMVNDVVDSFSPDVIHIQDHYPLSRAVVLAGKHRRISMVGTNHFMPENLAAYVPLVSKIKPVYNWVLWHWMLEVYNRLDAIAAPSKTAADLVRGQGARPPVYPISCGVNDQIFQFDPRVDRRAWRERYGIDLDRTVFFFVGRVDREKRLELVLQALHTLGRKDIQFVIAGNGANKATLISLAHELGLEKELVFTGFIPNSELAGVLNSIDIFVMPGDAELLSIATLEAMACARPVLAANAVALPELVSDGVNGRLFRSRDPVDLARCMTDLADHPEAWPAMGAASLARAREHGIDRIVERYESLYRSVISGNPV